MRSPLIGAVLIAGVAAAALPTLAAEPAAYLDVPIEGDLGTDAVPAGLRHCLKWASQSARIKHVVLRIKSTGGSPEAGSEMIRILGAKSGRFTFHALVSTAGGPATALALACDTIHVTPTARLGGGVKGEGEAVDDLISRALGAAAGNKHPADVARALLQAKAPAFAWTGDQGKVQTSGRLPRDVPDEKIVLHHEGARPLTLSADQAVKVGLAKGKVKKVEDLGASLGFSRWHSVGDYAVKAMRRMKLNREQAVAKAEEEARKREERLAANTEKREALVTYIQQNMNEAVDNEPDGAAYALEEDEFGDVEFTWESKRRWRERTEQAIAAWQRVQQASLALATLEKEAEGLGAPRVMHGLNLMQIHNRAGREIERLQKEKYRSGP